MTTARLRCVGLVGSFAATACGNLFGVGELTASDTTAGAAANAASAAGANAAGGSVPGLDATGGDAGAAGSGDATRGGSQSPGGATQMSGGTKPASGGASGSNPVSGGAPSGGRTQDGGAGGSDLGGSAGDDAGAGTAGSGGSDTNRPPSCQGLTASCGTSRSPSRDCCASPEVSGGTFFRSYDGLPDAGWDYDIWPANIHSFRLDAYEVTVGRFRRFVAAYPWQPPAGAGRNPANASDSGWSEGWSALLPPNAAALTRAVRACGSNTDTQPSPSTWTEQPDTNEALPINCVTWFEAFAFCAWDGARLPTEAEWNYAAAGGAQMRVYPWASKLLTDIDPNRAVYGTPIAPVGSKPSGDGLFGQSDLAGNVWEWNVDWFHDGYVVPCDNCAELQQTSDSSVRVLRGGSYYNQTPYLRSAERGNAAPTTRDSGYGFRCARDE